MHRLKKFILANITPIDSVIILSFVLFACFYQLNRVAGNSVFLFHNSDASNIASFAAALDHPELFSGDEILYSKNNFRFYSTIQIPLIRFITKFTGEYATAYNCMILPNILLQASGFYLLGLVLFRKRFWAVLLVVLNAVHVPLAMGDFWGTYTEALPRVTFEAFLPFLLAAVIYWRNNPKAWPFILGASGLLMYIHPVSAPAWGFCFWLSLFFLQPKEWTLFKRLGFMFLLGVIFLATILPFALSYFGTHLKVTSQEYEYVFKIIKLRYLKGFFDIPYGIESFFMNIAFTRVFLFGLFGSLYIFFKYKQERKKLLIFYLWITGILFISAVVPFVENKIALRNNRIPEAYNLIRNFKYLFPIMLIFCLWLFVAIHRNAKREATKRISVLFAFLLVFSWSSRQLYKEVVFLNKKGFSLFSRDKSKFANTMDVLNALKYLTPEQARIMSVSFHHELAIRYYAKRPLVFSGKDGGVLNYISSTETIRWYEKFMKMETLCDSIVAKIDNQSKMGLILGLGRDFGADFCVVDSSIFSGAFASLAPEVVYYNDDYLLLEVTQSLKK